uniref:Scavenger receptor class F member 2 n=1 Tax=Magallana gigas TaxID=29159 RepID=A0A8W8P6F7_MAGGI
MGFVSLNVLLYVVQIHGLENLALHQPTWEQNPWPDKMRDFGSENAVDEVYGCNGTYGEDCIYPCPTNCQDRRCDINTGLCFSCVPGYNGPKCNFVCNNNTYGPECALKCGNCSNGETCHHINGTCFNGCAEGALGDTCQGGRCDGGCKQGWTGNTCDQIRATNTQPCSCTESYTIVIVVVSVLIVVTGSLINFVIWKRNAAWGIFRNLQVNERKRIISIQNLKRLTNPRHMKKSIVIQTETGSNLTSLKRFSTKS